MSNVVRSDPLREIAAFDPFGDFADLLGTRRLRSLLREMPDEPAIKMDVSETNDAYRVKAEIPGVRKEDIHVSVDGNVVAISAEVQREKEEKKGEAVLRSERYYGKQSRRFTVLQDIDSTKAEARYQDGVLELTLPKKSGAPAKELTIQ